MKRLLFGSVVLIGFLYSGCDSTCCQDTPLVQTSIDKLGNLTPIPVITGLPAKAPCGTKLTASGTESSDPDGTITAYNWTLDGNALDRTQTAQATLPCDGQEHNICLTVTDNRGATQTTCQTIRIDNAKPEPKPADTCNIVPVITYEKADAMQYKFYCTQSTYNGEVIDAATAAACEWSTNKTFQDGTSYTHDQTGPLKWINVDPEKFKALDLTLTVKNEDCEATVTKHYFIPDDLPY